MKSECTANFVFFYLDEVLEKCVVKQNILSSSIIAENLVSDG
jgi:hypothetical protein